MAAVTGQFTKHEQLLSQSFSLDCGPRMKLSRSALVLFVLNAAWLAALSWFVARRLGPNLKETQIQFVTNYVPLAKSARSTVITNFIAPTSDFHWAQLESEDYRDYVTRLRSIGCPEQTIRDIVIADVDKLLPPKMQAATPHPK